jgi:hypothetical protein
MQTSSFAILLDQLKNLFNRFAEIPGNAKHGLGAGPNVATLQARHVAPAFANVVRQLRFFNPFGGTAFG